jgi:tetratricopeptide (TPR) repeat protein
LDTFRAIGDHTSEAGTLASLGHLHDGVADYTRAADRLGQALQASLAVHADEPTLDGLLHLAMLSQHLGQPEAALAHVEHARGIAVRMGSRSRQAQVLFARGRALEGLRRRPDARAAYQEALALHHGLATKASLTVQPHTGLARIALAEGDHPRALQHAEGLFSLLTDHPWAGVEDHHAAYHACYQVLHTHHDPRALTVARAAHTLLYTYADTIPDEQTRRSFLHAVPTHRELIDAATSDPDPAVGHTA